MAYNDCQKSFPQAEPTPNPSKEGSKTSDARSPFPTSEGLGVGAPKITDQEIKSKITIKIMKKTILAASAILLALTASQPAFAVDKAERQQKHQGANLYVKNLFDKLVWSGSYAVATSRTVGGTVAIQSSP